MAELHEALQDLGPLDWSSVPTSQQEIDQTLLRLFNSASVILDSVPIPAPEDAPLPPSPKPNRTAATASEVTPSAERSPSGLDHHEKLQKEWGKPLKIKPAENALGISMYKMSSKDGKGAWFARRSVHEGMSFKRFKRAMEYEFEKSLAEPGPPGTGNVRGIGGEERVEQVKSKNGEVQVLRLSAQFPGPTAPRDFVTLLVTSDNAIKDKHAGAHGEHQTPRHYMILSKPCNHPKTQPRTGFVRGYYESVEFIREVPRKLKTSQSSIDISHTVPAHSPQKHHLKDDGNAHGRNRAVTVGAATIDKSGKHPDPYDVDDNPVEWIMVTRSDPGGGIPRFMVERGTPGSICADAVKFVDWACTLPAADAVNSAAQTIQPPRRTSYVVGVAEVSQQDIQPLPKERPETTAPPAVASTEEHANGGIWGIATGAASILKPFTPQVVLDHLPTTPNPPSRPQLQEPASPTARSVGSRTSFASAEEHWSSASSAGESNSLPSHPASPTASREVQHHKELEKLDDRKQALHAKFAATQSKLDEAQAKQEKAETGLDQKTKEKHERELKKHEEKYQKELRKIEEKQAKERKKLAERTRKQTEKDDRVRLTRERDEAREKLDIAQGEIKHLKALVATLQRENTALVAKFGRADLDGVKSAIAGIGIDNGLNGGSSSGSNIVMTSGGTRSRGSSLSRAMKKMTGDAGGGGSSTINSNNSHSPYSSSTLRSGGS